VPDFSIIAQTPAVRAIVQEGMLERVFHDALFPGLMFRGEAVPQEWPAGVGDTLYFTAPGLMDVDARPIVPGNDADVATYTMEQWLAQVQQYGKSIDTDMPTSMVAIANLFLRNAHQLGLHGAQTINRIVRDRMYNGAEAGWTVVTTGPFAGVATIRVARLNGFTRARNPTLLAGSQVRYDPVSASNPLAITINDAGAGGPTAYSVIAYTPDNAGDEVGPGTITLSANVNNVANRAYVQSSDKSDLIFSGGGQRVDDVTAADVPSFDDVRTSVSRLRQNAVPRHPDGHYHAHCSPDSISRLFGTPEFQRINTALPDYYMYRQFALGEFLGVVYYENIECPIPQTVVGGTTATFSLQDPFSPELYGGTGAGTTAGQPLYRILFTGQGGIYEYWMDHSNLLTEAGITGKIGEPTINNNGIEVMTDRLKLILRAPLDRLQQKVASTWTLFADWPVRTDGASGDAARIKRFVSLVHS
jgi:hypothetical protein